MFVIFGEVLMDLVIQDNGQHLDGHIGGGPFNTGLALARLGEETCFSHPISQDYYGRRIMEFCHQNNIHYGCPYLSPFSTPLAMTHLDENGKAEYRFYRHQTAERDLQEAAIIDALPETIEAIHTGTLAIAEEPDLSITLSILSKAKEKGGIVSVDPNIRARNFADQAYYRDCVFASMKLADIIKVSDDDCAFLYPNISPDAALLNLNKDFPEASLIIMTRGDKGISAYYHNQLINYNPTRKPLNGGDTIGAGDCFIAGVLYQCKQLGFLSRSTITHMAEMDIISILTIADRIAGLNCCAQGCNPPHLDQLNL